MIIIFAMPIYCNLFRRVTENNKIRVNFVNFIEFYVERAVKPVPFKKIPDRGNKNFLVLGAPF